MTQENRPPKLVNNAMRTLARSALVDILDDKHPPEIRLRALELVIPMMMSDDYAPELPPMDRDYDALHRAILSSVSELLKAQDIHDNVLTAVLDRIDLIFSEL